MSLLLNRLCQGLCHPFIEAYAVSRCHHGNTLMHIGLQAHIEGAGKRLLRLSSFFGAKNSTILYN